MMIVCMDETYDLMYASWAFTTLEVLHKKLKLLHNIPDTSMKVPF